MCVLEEGDVKKTNALEFRPQPVFHFHQSSLRQNPSRPVLAEASDFELIVWDVWRICFAETCLDHTGSNRLVTSSSSSSSCVCLMNTLAYECQCESQEDKSPKQGTCLFFFRLSKYRFFSPPFPPLPLLLIL